MANKKMRSPWGKLTKGTEGKNRKVRVIIPRTQEAEDTYIDWLLLWGDVADQVVAKVNKKILRFLEVEKVDEVEEEVAKFLSRQEAYNFMADHREWIALHYKWNTQTEQIEWRRPLVDLFSDTQQFETERFEK